MLPDFPEAKDHARRAFERAVRHKIGESEPLLRGMRRTRVHEGRTARITRADESSSQIAFEVARAEVTVTRAQMRQITIPELLKHAEAVAEQLAGHQARMMFSRISEAAEEVGNAVSAAEMGGKGAFLEMQRRLQVEFDPITLEPKGLVIVLHPDQVERFKSDAEQWEKDPAFNAEMKRIRDKQIEEWRARENRRKLVD